MSIIYQPPEGAALDSAASDSRWTEALRHADAMRDRDLMADVMPAKSGGYLVHLDGADLDRLAGMIGGAR